MQNTKLRLLRTFSGFRVEKAAFVLLLFLAVQPLFGIMTSVSSQKDLVALFYGKASLIRAVGYVGLAFAAVDYFCKWAVYGKETFFRTFLSSPWTGILTVLFLWSFLTSCTAQNSYNAFFGDPYRYEGFFTYVAYAGIYAAASLLQNKKYQKWLFRTAVIVSDVLALAVILKEMSGTNRILYRSSLVFAWSGTFVNSNHYGYYLAVMGALCVALYLETQSIPWKIAYGSIFTLDLIVLLFNLGLGSYLALCIGMVVYTVLTFVRKGWKKAWPVAILLAILVVCSFTVNGGKMIKDATTAAGEAADVGGTAISGGDISETGDAGSGRMRLWIGAAKCIGDHPVLGVGPENIQLVTEHYTGNWGDIPHNEYLQVGANMGIPGMALFVAALLCLFIFCFIKCRKMQDGAMIGFMGAGVYAVSAFVGVSMTIATFMLFLFAGIANSWFKAQHEKAMSDEMLARIDAAKAASAASAQAETAGREAPEMPTGSAATVVVESSAADPAVEAAAEGTVAAETEEGNAGSPAPAKAEAETENV